MNERAASLFPALLAIRTFREGEAWGKAEGLRAAVLDSCELLGVEPTGEQWARLGGTGAGEFEALRLALKQTRRWPD
jgi:hypothetical protein